MTTRRFFSAHPVINKSIRITADELFHLKNVNRARLEDEVEIIDGKGTLLSGKIRKIDNNEALVAIHKEEKVPKPPLRIIIAASLLKKKNMSLMIEKLTEIGVDEIRPLVYTRTDEKYSPAMLKKWQRIAAQSLKVSKRLWLTDIFPPVSIKEIGELARGIKTRIALDIGGESCSKANFDFPAIAVVGPPGDFVEEERDLLRKNCFVPYRINDCTMKSETAAISIAAILKMIS